MNFAELTPTAYQYLNIERGFSDKSINDFEIKSISYPCEIRNILEKKWNLDRLINCGIMKTSEKGNVDFIWKHEVILFPFYNEKHELCYVQARRIGNNEPRYINLYNVKTDIFNMQIVNYLKKDEYLYICEGVTDVISMHENGHKAIGILGASGFKKEWAYRLRNYKLRIMPDNDTAGESFAKKVHAAFRDIGKPIEVVKMTGGKDYSEWVKNKVKRRGKRESEDN